MFIYGDFYLILMVMTWNYLNVTLQLILCPCLWTLYMPIFALIISDGPITIYWQAAYMVLPYRLDIFNNFDIFFISYKIYFLISYLDTSGQICNKEMYGVITNKIICQIAINSNNMSLCFFSFKITGSFDNWQTKSLFLDKTLILKIKETTLCTCTSIGKL